MKNIWGRALSGQSNFINLCNNLKFAEMEILQGQNTAGKKQSNKTIYAMKKTLKTIYYYYYRL